MKKGVRKKTTPEDTSYKQVVLKDCAFSDRADEIATITGSGMEPLYHDGDQIFIEYCNEIAVGEVGVFDLPDIGPVIRYKSAAGLCRLNPDADDKILSEEGGRVIGRVLGRVTPEMIPTDEERDLYFEALREKENHPEWFE